MSLAFVLFPGFLTRTPGSLGSLHLPRSSESKPSTPSCVLLCGTPHSTGSFLGPAPVAGPQDTVGFALGVPFGHRLAFVPLALAAGDGDLDLGHAVLEVDLERH